MFNRLLSTARLSSPQAVSLALLLLRLVTGVAFAYHGWPKVQAPFTWMTEAGMLGVPSLLQAAAALSEFAGGLLLALGLLTPLAALGILGTMLGALVLVHFPAGHPFVDMTHEGHSYELALVYGVIALVVLVTNGGRYTLDHALGLWKPTECPAE